MPSHTFVRSNISNRLIFVVDAFKLMFNSSENRHCPYVQNNCPSVYPSYHINIFQTHYRVHCILSCGHNNSIEMRSACCSFILKRWHMCTLYRRNVNQIQTAWLHWYILIRLREKLVIRCVAERIPSTWTYFKFFSFSHYTFLLYIYEYCLHIMLESYKLFHSNDYCDKCLRMLGYIAAKPHWRISCVWKSLHYKFMRHSQTHKPKIFSEHWICGGHYECGIHQAHSDSIYW